MLLSRQHRVPHAMPEEQHAMRPAEKARSEHRIGPPVQNRLQERRIVRRVVLQVGVLDDDDVALRLREAGPQRRALALVALVVEDAHVIALDPVHDLARAIGRGVVHDDDFLAVRRGLDLPDDLGDEVLLVVNRDDDREQRAGILCHADLRRLWLSSMSGVYTRPRAGFKARAGFAGRIGA